MINQRSLDRLCALYGIATEFTDQLGRHIVVPRSTKIAVLAEMGVKVASSADAAHAIEKYEHRAWCRTLAPVQVVQENEKPIRIYLTLPADQAAQQFTWTLTTESGEQLRGRIHPRELVILAERRINGKSFVKYGFDLPRAPGSGYHRIELENVGRALNACMSLIVAPGRCYQPPVLCGNGRVWGTTVQLYAIRSRRNWGMGDYTDLKNLIETCGRAGAAIVGVNPLHALFPHNPAHASPYSPSSRRCHNILYLDVEAVADFNECRAALEAVAATEFQMRLRKSREATLVDYEEVAAIKLPILGQLYRHFLDRHLACESSRGQAFREFQAAGGDVLRSQALFDALQEHFHAQDSSMWGWPKWPASYRNPGSGAVAAFHSRHQQRVEFYQYLQWQAELQLTAVGECSSQLKLGVGLYQDLAISVDPGGAEAWANQNLYALSASIGSPPDAISTDGQDWGLPPFIPQHLTEAAYAPFIATLRNNMRHAGALRIDHVMGLMRLFWIPRDAPPNDGTYVSYPFTDLLGILALESQRNHCLVIGEDLGNVSQEVPEALGPLGVLSYRLLYFEKTSSEDFKAPADYPSAALVAVSTHDLPTLTGFWQGFDLNTRTQLNLFPSDAYLAQQIVNRTQDRARLLMALEREELLPESVKVRPVSMPEMSTELVAAIHIYLARTPAKVMMVHIEDLLGQIEQVNLPGTTNEYPNWRRKLSLTLEDWRADARIKTVAEALCREREAIPQPQSRSAGLSPVSRIPLATYRLQFNRNFTFAQATALVPYLSALGVSHVYASPYLKARPGSMHGYDIIDHNSFNPEIGTPEDFERFAAALRSHNMGQVLDIVPNHMGIMGADNAWWLDLLENGQASDYADYFDIDWEPLQDDLHGKVLVPVLSDQYGTVLESGELKLRFDQRRGEFSIFYHDHCFPVDPKEYSLIIGYRLDKLVERLGADHSLLFEFQNLLTAFGHLPARASASPEKIAERNRNKEIHKRRLAELCGLSPDIPRFIEENLKEINGVVGNPASFNALHELIKVQAYRLAYWRVAADDINYRRFFDINDLAGLRMENEAVFDATHRLVLQLLAEGKVDALRIDHPDGLYDPVQYLRRLQERFSGATDARNHKTTMQFKPVYIVLEKIIAGYERLPDDWPVHGTTGYRFVNVVNGLFVDTGAELKMSRIYSAFSGETIDFDEVLYRSKRLIMKVALSSELNVLANLLRRIANARRHTCDFTLNSLRSALAEIVACFPVYRTYVTADKVSAEDRRFIEWAVSVAKRRSQAAEISIFDFVRDVLTTSIADGKNDDYRKLSVSFAMKFQQFTGPVMAKGMEDTSFYRYNRLVSLNEVGGDPRSFGFTLNAFHGASKDRANSWPQTMIATSTHDGKRSEDVRARINVLSEMPAAWRLSLRRWSRINRSKKQKVEGAPAPSRNDEYLLYQTLIGVWPLEEFNETKLAALRERIQLYMRKAVREAKVHSSWVNPNADYEEALSNFVGGLLGAFENNLFLADFLPAQKRITRFGMLNSLSQTLIKLTSPGVPDIYQGNELWDFSLVDPDNRRPVDYDRRRLMLQRLQTFMTVPHNELPARVHVIADSMEDGRCKLYLHWRTLALRREYPRLFQEGDYQPLSAVGEKADHVCAYARQTEDQAIVVVAPRFFARLAGDGDAGPTVASVWGNTRIELPGPMEQLTFVNIFTSERLAPVRRDGKTYLLLSTLHAHFPVALVQAGK